LILFSKLGKDDEYGVKKLGVDNDLRKNPYPWDLLWHQARLVTYKVPSSANE
jgi:hypothetical protein